MWDKIKNEVIVQLMIKGIPYIEKEDGFVLVTPWCNVEISGSPYKPEYWVADTKCRLVEIVGCIIKSKQDQQDDLEEEVEANEMYI